MKIGRIFHHKPKIFVVGCYKKNPKLRPTARQAMHHRWIVQHCGIPPPLPPPIAVRKYMDRLSLSPPRQTQHHHHQQQYDQDRPEQPLNDENARPSILNGRPRSR